MAHTTSASDTVEHTAAPAARETGPPPVPPPGPFVRALRVVAVAGCLPYLALKVAWIAGSRVGVPDGSVLLEHRGLMAGANSATVLMDASVIVLALLLTRPWGGRAPAWLLLLPLWAATGLLTPIMAGYPLQLLVGLSGGGAPADGSSSEPFLDEWVFGVVYTGFIVQGLALGALFVRYARNRWGRLWQGTVGQLPPSALAAAQRPLAVAAAVVALFPIAVHLLWASGSTTGLTPGLADGSGADSRVLDVMWVLLLAVTAAAGPVLAFRGWRRLPLAVPLMLGWLGSGSVACWGAWLSITSLAGMSDLAERPTPLMNLTYAGQMIAGLLVLTLGAHHCAERAAATR
ncbi:hypothetical protein [Streptomyces sp. NPDC058045]|uniref:hypothetical protein n=1 Tax=Streptomyces sp. NPDC058045 TaxID=3346311 RepID=UPI0036ED24B2